MADLITFPLGFESSAAYATVNKLAAYAQKRFSSIGIGGGNDRFTEMDRSARKFARTLEFANDRMVAFAASTTIVYGLGKAFSSLYNNALQAEKALAEIQVNIKLTTKEMSQLTSELFVAANKTGQSFYVAAEAAAEFGRQGLKAADVAKATHSALVLSQISGMEAADSVKALTSAINTFGASSADYSALVNKMAAADTNFAVSSKDLADAISRVGSTAKDAGVSVDQLLAIVTSLQQSTARGGAVIGNSLKTIFTRLQRNDVATALENLGIQTRDADGNFLNQINVLERLAKSYDNLSESQQSVISEKLGGVYQINIVKGIIQDLSRETSNYSQALYTVEKAQNEAFLKSEFLGKTTLNKINAAKNAFIQLSEVIGSMGITSSVSMWATEFANMATDIATSLKKPLEEKSGWDKAGAAFVQGLISAVTGPALGTAIIGTLKLGWRVLRNVGSDLGGTFSGNGQAQLFARLKARSEEANKIFLAIQSEKELNMAMQRGNQTLAQRISLMSRMSGSTIPIPQVPFSTIPRKAAGHIPAMIQEMADVSAGVGGANKHARPVKKKLILSPGGVPQDVIVNTHEKIVRNYMGSGADAVFNPDMIRQVGGKQKLSLFGQVENLAGGFVSKFKKMAKIGAVSAGLAGATIGGVGYKVLNDIKQNPDLAAQYLGQTVGSPFRYKLAKKTVGFVADIPGVRSSVGNFLANNTSQTISGSLAGYGIESPTSLLLSPKLSQQEKLQDISKRLKNHGPSNADFYDLAFRKISGNDVSQHPLVKQGFVKISKDSLHISRGMDKEIDSLLSSTIKFHDV